MSGVKWVSLFLVVVLVLTSSAGAWAQKLQDYEFAAGGIMLEEPGGPGYRFGAGVATAVTVPMRAVTCLVGSALGFVVLAVSFGTEYRRAMAVTEEGCQGPWILSEDQMRGDAWEEGLR